MRTRIPQRLKQRLASPNGSRRTSRDARRLLPVLAGALSLAVLLMAGCSRREPAKGPAAEANPAPADPAASAVPARPAERGPGTPAAAPMPAVVANTGNVDAALGQLSLELRKYVVRTRSVPKNFDEFIQQSHVQAPPPPAGKKYAIKDQAVVLVKL